MKYSGFLLNQEECYERVQKNHEGCGGYSCICTDIFRYECSGNCAGSYNGGYGKNTVVKSITVSNLPAGTLTLKAGKSFALKTNVAAKELKFVTSNRRIATVTTAGVIKAGNVKMGQLRLQCR